MAEAYRAKWIITSSEENENLYEDSVLIVDNGKISDIICEADLVEEDYENYTDYGNAVITPGFINLFTQLQYSDVFKTKSKGLLPTTKRFIFGWHKFFSMLGIPKNKYSMHLAEVEKEYKCLSKKDKMTSFKSGLKALILSGTTCFVEVSDDLNHFELLNKLPIKTFFFFDLYADTYKKSKIEYKKFKKIIGKLKKKLTDNTYFGVYPHSIWSVNKLLWKYIFKYVKKNNLFLMTELMESEEEAQWFQKDENTESGLDFYNMFLGHKKLIPEKEYKSSVKYLEGIKVLNKNVIIKNGNYLNNEELEILSSHNVKIAYSPRVNKKIFQKSQSTATLLKYFSKNFGFCTDALTNNEDLNILSELFSVNIELPIEEAIKYITIYPARMLVIDDITGSLDVGKHADFNVFKLNKKQTLDEFKNFATPNDVYIHGKLIVKEQKLITE